LPWWLGLPLTATAMFYGSVVWAQLMGQYYALYLEDGEELNIGVQVVDATETAKD
jgi:hypothetical protein